MTTLADKIAAEVRSHPSRPPLAALAASMLTRLAEAELRYVSADVAAQRVRDAGIPREEADFPSGNVFEILERGPESEVDHALLSALAVSHWVDLPGTRRTSVMEAWVDHALWLDTQTPYPVFAYVDRLLESSVAATFWQKVGARLESCRADTPASAGQAAGWLTALRLSTSATAKQALAGAKELTETGQLPDLIMLDLRLPDQSGAGAGAGAGADTDRGQRLEGHAGQAAQGGFRGVLRLVSGWALLQWVARGVAYLLTLRRQVTLALGETGVEVDARTELLGREVRRVRSTIPFHAVLGAGREVRYPQLHLLVGALALSVGLLLGGVWVAEGVRTGETYLLLAGAALVSLGAGLDLALSVLPLGRSGRVAMHLDGPGHRRLAVVGASEEAVDRFLSQLRRRLIRAGE